VHGVIGPGGRGVISASTDAVAAEETRAWLIAERIPTAVPADLGLRAMPRWGAVDPFENPSTGQARFWASATRRAAVVAEGDDAVIALPRGAVSEMKRTDAPPALLELLDAPPPARVAVFGGAWVPEGEPEYQEAWMLGRRCAQAGIELVNGGYGGVMAAVSRGAAEARGTVVGVTIGSFSEHVPVNQWLTHEIEADDLFARLPLICDAEAWVAFPGGVGTLSEVALCWNLVQTESVAPRPLIIVGERWDRALKTFRELLMAEDVHFDLVRSAISADDAIEQLDEIGLPAG
jgi:uncharacterized protein (TIGR00730 family)